MSTLTRKITGDKSKIPANAPQISNHRLAIFTIGWRIESGRGDGAGRSAFSVYRFGQFRAELAAVSQTLDAASVALSNWYFIFNTSKLFPGIHHRPE
jgi:hypothetical protein